MPPVYKGSTFELQPGEYDFQRGQGWRGTRIAKGALADISAEVQAMQLYCNRIKLKVGTDYSEAIGTFDGLTDGGDDQTGRGEEVWGVEYNQDEISIYEGPFADDTEAIKTGSIAVIRKAVQDFERSEANAEELGPAGDGTWTPGGANGQFNSFFSGSPGVSARARAFALFNEVIKGRTHLRFFQPTVVFASTYGRQFTTKKAIPGRPTIYASTAALSNALPIPDAILFELPDGVWLEHPPQVRRTTGDRTEISQRWEWFENYSSVAYPQG